MEQIVKYIDYGDNVMENLKELSRKYEKNFHPLLIVANANNTPFTFYMSVFEIIYTFNECSTGFDILFKSFFVFSLQYPQKI